MYCEFNYCIYNRAYACTAEEIEINSVGMCAACEIITVPQENIDRYKEKRLNEIEEIWKKYEQK